MSGKTEQELDRYFLPRELLASNRKSDGNIYHTYRAWLKQEYCHNGQAACCIIKELSQKQVPVYQALSKTKHAHLENIYGILEIGGEYFAVNEYIAPPSCLQGSLLADENMISLTLEDFIKKYHGSLNGKELSPEERNRQALFILLQLCKALNKIYEAGFVHGDIHPGNILLTDVDPECEIKETENIGFSVKLIDFDNTQAAKKSDHAVTHIMGTKPFAAPEILDFTYPLDKADIYSLGCILYYAIYEESPKEAVRNNGITASKEANRIFRRCTASYEARYKNLSALIKDLKHALWIPSNPFRAFLHRLPGFRSHTPWKAVVASYMYLSLLIFTICILQPAFQNGLPLTEEQKYGLDTVLLFVAEIVVLFDAFGIGEHSKKYIYLKNTHPFLNALIKTACATVVFLVFLLLFFI